MLILAPFQLASRQYVETSRIRAEKAQVSTAFPGTRDGQNTLPGRGLVCGQEHHCDFLVLVFPFAAERARIKERHDGLILASGRGNCRKFSGHWSEKCRTRATNMSHDATRRKALCAAAAPTRKRQNQAKLQNKCKLNQNQHCFTQRLCGMAMELPVRPADTQMRQLSISDTFQLGGALPMAMCRPKAATRKALCTTLFSPQSCRNRAVSSRFSRKNRTGNSKALPGANIYFDNAACIADNSLCEILHSNTTDIKPPVAEMRNLGKQVRKIMFAETLFFSPMWYLAAARKAEIPPDADLLRAPQVTGRGFARAVTDWAWRGGPLAGPGK
jgi:hypothetical protein